MRNLGIADKATVYVKVETAVDTFKVDVFLHSVPFTRAGKIARIYADRVVLWNIGRVTRVRILYVYVLYLVIAVELPH